MKNRSIFVRSILLSVTLIALILFVPARSAAQTASANDVVIVLPFENTSAAREFNWIGESFADALSELLNVPGMIVVSSDERELTYQRLRLPVTTLPSRATAIKIAREAKATLVVLGTYSVTPAKGEQTPAEISGTARVIKVSEGRLTGEPAADGRWSPVQYNFGGPLQTLQNMQGRLAYQVLYQRDKALPFSLMQFVERTTKIPPRAFESYVKGAMTDDGEKRVAYLQNALREYARANAGATYSQAAFELGHLYFRQYDWKRAAEYFSKIQDRDRRYAEAAFYGALAYWQMKDLVSALGTLLPLAADVPLTGVYNNAGAISAQAAREEKKPEERGRLLKQALTFLERAVESAPEDTLARFNYAHALFISGKYAEAAEQLSPVIEAIPQDGQAYFLFAKALERTNRAEAATAADNQARRYLPAYAKWQTEWQRSQTAMEIAPRLLMNFNRADYYEALLDKTRKEKEEPPGTTAQELLAKARELYQAGRDDEALQELRRTLTVEPMNAEAHLMIGRISLRRADQDAAVSVLRTAIFWDPKLIDAHILLGRIFLERGDRGMALTYARNATQIDANNQEAVALLRQVETGAR